MDRQLGAYSADTGTLSIDDLPAELRAWVASRRYITRYPEGCDETRFSWRWEGQRLLESVPEWVPAFNYFSPQAAQDALLLAALRAWEGGWRP